MTRAALVWGTGIAGAATARALVARGWTVVVADDRDTAAGRELAAELDADYHPCPDGPAVDRLLDDVALLVPSPGVPERHLAVTQALHRGVPVRSEIDIAYEWEQTRPGGPRPMLAVTGTDGKTTTTLMAVEMLRAAGHRAIDAGNTDTPLVAALDLDVDVFVVECTSFRLAFTEVFRPAAAVWLNLAEDHQDWHESMTTYRDAKARIWRFQRADDVAIGFVDDEVVMHELGRAPAGRHRTFGRTGADYRVDDGVLNGPGGAIAEVAGMRRSLPHDVTNALAAGALVVETGLAGPDAISRALAAFSGAPHRIELVGDDAGVRYYDDSKATTPHAALTAIRAFDSVVLIAGGRNKGLDLSPMATAADHVRAVVAIGDSAPLIAAAFEGRCPVLAASDMAGAVRAARGAAVEGDVVLLSPGCASYDWYSGYPERGEHFARCVRELIDGGKDMT